MDYNHSSAIITTSLNLLMLVTLMYIGHNKSLSCSELRGSHFPLMNLHERSLSVLACRYVDEVIIGAPQEVSNDMVCYYLLLYASICREELNSICICSMLDVIFSIDKHDVFYCISKCIISSFHLLSFFKM